MKNLSIILLSILLNINLMSQTSFYELKAETIDGKPFDFSTLKGKKVMIVNTASKCGYTPQYKDLERMYKLYGGSKFEIIGFPSNDFMSQEPLNNKEIKEFCTKNYGVTFPMMSKVSVKGNKMHPVYQWLTSKEKNGFDDTVVKWNFQKYLIDSTGQLNKVIYSKTAPGDQEIIDWLIK